MVRAKDVLVQNLNLGAYPAVAAEECDSHRLTNPAGSPAAN